MIVTARGKLDGVDTARPTETSTTPREDVVPPSTCVDPIAGPPPLRVCSCRCRIEGGMRAHHDRLTAVETDPDELVELLELAVTWGELDYSASEVVPPDRWLVLAENHRWIDPARMGRLFSLAADIALRSPRGTDARPGLRAAIGG